MTVRKLRADELPAAWELGRLAFGSTSPPSAWTLKPLPGSTRYGAFDAAGRLIGKAVDLHHEQWWSGRRVAAADIAGVAVRPESRGAGVAGALLDTLLREARERGAAVSALFPTTTGPYRRYGWEVAGTLRMVELPTVALTRIRSRTGLTVRPGETRDLPAVADLYQRIASERCGLLTRRGTLFDHLEPMTELPPGVDGLTLVEERGRLLGCASWQRGPGYGPNCVLTVHDLFARTGEAARELVGVLASWHSVTPILRLQLLEHDALTAHLPMEQARVHEQNIWMHRPVDVVRAVETRGWPAYARGRVDFTLIDDLAPWNTGAWRLEVADGAARLTRTDNEPELTLSVRGFSLLYTGMSRAAAVAEAGLLRLPLGCDPAPLDLLGAGGRAELLDYF